MARHSAVIVLPCYENNYPAYVNDKGMRTYILCFEHKKQKYVAADGCCKIVGPRTPTKGLTRQNIKGRNC